MSFSNAIRRTAGGAIAATAAMLALAAPSSAADLGGRPYSPPPRDAGVPVRPLQIERWTGFYFGATAGYGFGTTGVSGASGAFDVDSEGAVGTVFGGYNWQVGNAVFGLEADIGIGNGDGSAPGALGVVSQELNSFGSLRARAGLLVMPNLLLYATGGLAWADMDLKVANVGGANETFTGYQIGFGSELMMSPNWTLRLEYLYTDLGEKTLAPAGVSDRFDPDFHTVRAGLTFKF